MTNTLQLPDWIKREIPPFLTSSFFRSSFGKIHYLSGGRGKTILLLHGNPTWSFLWRKVIGALETEQFSVIAPDLLNLGFSDALSSENFSLENHSKALVELIEGLNLKDITLVVQDWGGPIGLNAAAQVPHRISSLVILNTGISKPTPPFKISKFHEFVNKNFLPEIAFKIFGFPMYTLHQVQFDKSTIRGNVAKAYRFPIRLKKRWSSALQFARMVPNNEQHPTFRYFDKIENYCANFQGKVEVIWGVKDPVLGRGLKKIKTILPNAHFTELNAGHFLQEECPLEIAAAIRRATLLTF